ncbi:unnamed protein product [Arctogadus glacialis]
MVQVSESGPLCDSASVRVLFPRLDPAGDSGTGVPGERRRSWRRKASGTLGTPSEGDADIAQADGEEGGERRAAVATLL